MKRISEYAFIATLEGESLELLVTPEEWHSRALGVVPEIDTSQRRSIEDAYQAALAAANQGQPPGV